MTQRGEDERSGGVAPPTTRPGIAACGAMAEAPSPRSEEPPAVQLPWSSVRLGAEPATVRVDGHAELRPVIHDGVPLDAGASVRAVSPRCGHPLSIDLASVVQRGTGRMAFGAAAPAILIDDVIRAFGLQSRTLDGRLVLSGTNGLPPSFAVLPCEQCQQLHLAVASSGEVSPGRQQLVFEGLAPLDRLSATSTGEHRAVPPPAPQASAEAALHAAAKAGRVRPPTAPGRDRLFSPAASGDLVTADAGQQLVARSGPTPRSHPLPPVPGEPDRGPRLVVLAAILLGAATAGVLVVLHLWSWSAWGRSQDLANTGVATEATVLATDEAHLPGGADRYSISYRYDAALPADTPVGQGGSGSTVTESGTDDVDQGAFEQARQSRSVTIRYDRADPSRSAVARDDSATTQLAMVALFDVAVLVGAAVMWRHLRRTRRR